MVIQIRSLQPLGAYIHVSVMGSTATAATLNTGTGRFRPALHVAVYGKVRPMLMIHVGLHVRTSYGPVRLQSQSPQLYSSIG